jgi:hypothetical protein
MCFVPLSLPSFRIAFLASVTFIISDSFINYLCVNFIRLYIKFSNAKKAEWNVTIKRETKYSEKYSKDGFSCLMEADKNIFVSGYINNSKQAFFENAAEPLTAFIDIG